MAQLGMGNLLSALDQNDIGDIAGAVKEDPTLLQPPKKGMAGELATAANNLTQFFGLLFSDENAIQVAQRTKVADEARDAEAVQQKLIPVIAEGRQKRLEQTRQDKLEYQKEQMEQRRAAFLQGAMDNYAWQNDDGSLRALSADEAMQAADSALHYHDNPQDGLEHKPLPKNLVVLNQVTKQQMLSAQQDKMLAKRDADMAARSEAAAKRAETRANTRADTKEADAEAKATAKANAAALAQVNSQLNAAEAQTRGAALRAGAPPAEAEAQARAAVRSGAVAMALDAAGDPAAWEDVPRLRTIANRADMTPEQLKSWGERIARSAKASGATPSPKLNAFLDSIGVGK